MGSMKMRFGIVAAVVALAVPAAIAFAGNTTFTGKGTDDKNVTVQFTKHGKKFVTDFQTSDMFFVCSDGGDGPGSLDLGATQIAIKDNGKFSLRETNLLQDDIVDKIRVKGEFKSKTKATGTTKETQTQGDLTCTAKVDWKAKG